MSSTIWTIDHFATMVSLRVPRFVGVLLLLLPAETLPLDTSKGQSKRNNLRKQLVAQENATQTNETISNSSETVPPTPFDEAAKHLVVDFDPSDQDILESSVDVKDFTVESDDVSGNEIQDSDDEDEDEDSYDLGESSDDEDHDKENEETLKVNGLKDIKINSKNRITNGRKQKARKSRVPQTNAKAATGRRLDAVADAEKGNGDRELFLWPVGIFSLNMLF